MSPEAEIDPELIKDVTGYISVVLLTLLYLPQVYSVYRSRNSVGLTGAYLIIAILLTIDTMIYGVYLGEYPLIIANIIAFCSVSMLMVAKLMWPSSPNVRELEFHPYVPEII